MVCNTDNLYAFYQAHPIPTPEDTKGGDTKGDAKSRYTLASFSASAFLSASLSSFTSGRGLKLGDIPSRLPLDGCRLLGALSANSSLIVCPRALKSTGFVTYRENPAATQRSATSLITFAERATIGTDG